MENRRQQEIAQETESTSRDHPLSSHRVQAFLFVGLVAFIGGMVYLFWPNTTPPNPTPVSLSVALPLITPTPAPIPSATPSRPLVVENRTLPTPPTGSVSGALRPAAEAVGWVTNLDDRSHFSVPNIHAGFFRGHTYYGVLQFDLSEVPAGSTLTSAALELTGLDAQNLGTGGAWHLRLLDPALDTAWPELSFETLHNAAVGTTIAGPLTATDLRQNQVNDFEFDAESLAALQQRLARGVVSFRLDGPLSGEDNLFTWDSGYHSGEGLETGPVLRLVVIPAAGPEYVIVTSTPTPENIITMAAQAATATYIAATTGTPTPAPENWVTPIIIVSQPTPANAATIAYQKAEATAAAFLFGTATPTPPNVWTATPTSPSVLAGNTTAIAIAPGELIPHYVIVTSTPTPENIITVAAMAAEATRVAAAVGTYTPVPENWVTPIVVTPPPPPANTATAVYQETMAAAQTLLFGTGTPFNVWTATPTPVTVLLNGEIATPWATPTPTATPQPVPALLVGKIAFLSNRSGGPQPLPQPLIYVMDPDGSNLAVMTDQTIYETALVRDHYSAGQRFRVFVKNAPRTDGKMVPALYTYDYFYNAEQQLTHFGAGAAWDPAWSPAREQIVFTSNDSHDDEIWVVDGDGRNLVQLTAGNTEYNAREIGKDTFIPEQNGHASWSPNGTQIVFWSNRTGNRQIWIMNVDGSNLYSLSTTNHDDWDPVWIKYTDPARNPVPDSTQNPQ